MAAGLATVLLTGCSVHLNAGTAGEEKAERELSEIDGVAVVSANGLNSLPFAGTVSTRVVTDDGLSDAELLTLTDEVGRWASRHSGPGTSYDSPRIRADGFEFFLGRTGGETRRILDVVDPLRKGGRWLGGEISSDGPSGTSPAYVSVFADDPADLVAAWDAAKGAAAASGWNDVSAQAAAWNEPPGDVLLPEHADLRIDDRPVGGGGPTGDPSAEVAAYERVVAEHRVTTASITPGRLHLHLADLRDVSDATAIVQRVAPDTDAVLDGGVVTKEDDPGVTGRTPPSADEYAEADRLAVVADGPGVTAIALRPERVEVTADDADTVLTTAAALAAAEPEDPVTSVSVQVDGDESGLAVTGSPAHLAEAVAIAQQLQGFQPARAGVTATNASVEAAVQDVSEVADLVRPLRSLLPEGTAVLVRSAGRSLDAAASLTVVDGVLTVDPLPSGETSTPERTELGEAARDAWAG